MRKLVSTAIVLLAASTFAFAGEIQTAKGTVQDVSGNTVIVEAENGERWSFEAISGSKVLAEGAAYKKRSLDAVRMKPTVGNFVSENVWLIFCDGHQNHPFLSDMNSQNPQSLVQMDSVSGEPG